MIGEAGDWIARHRAELGLSLRITAAGLLAFAAGQLLGLPQVYWAVLTAIIVMQASLGGSLKATADRLIGTIAGAIWGVAATVGVPHATPLATTGALAVALVPLAVLVALSPSYRVAPVTAAIVLLGPSGAAGIVEAALERVVEISVGCVVALAVALAIAPARAHQLICEVAAEALAAMGDQVALLLGDISEAIDPTAALALHDRIRAAIEKAAAIAPEAVRERASYLTDAPHPDPLVRTMRRISHDLVMIARALREPFPEPIRSRLNEPSRRVSATIAAFLAEIGTALARRAAPPPFEPIAEALADYDAAIADLRRDRLIVPLPAEDAERIFGLAFALQQLRRNLEELASRTAEMARERKTE